MELRDTRDDLWVITFALLMGLRRDRSIVTAKNLRTGELLKTPRDFTKICELVPFNDWPPFAQGSHGQMIVANNENQERLF